MSVFETAGAQAAAMQAQGATAAQINAYLATMGYGMAPAGYGAAVAPSIDAWVGQPAVPSPVAQGPALPAEVTAGATLAARGLAWVISWLLTTWGGRAVIAALVAVLGKSNILSELGEVAATIIPGQQEWLGEWPAGLGQIEGRLVQKWTAGGAKVYFASFEQPTRQGSHIQYYVFSVKRQAWLPYSYRRNIVFGARELDIASALGGKRRIGKKTALRALAGRYGGTRAKGGK